MLTKVLPMALVKCTGVQGICAPLAAGNLFCYHPQGDEIQSVLLAQRGHWKCPESAIYSSPLLLCSWRHYPTLWSAHCSFHPGSGTLCIPTELAQAVGSSHSELELAEVIGDLVTISSNILEDDFLWVVLHCRLACSFSFDTNFLWQKESCDFWKLNFSIS